MAQYKTTYTGVEDLISAAMLTLLMQKLRTEVPVDDASRAQVLKGGLLQDDPMGVVVLVHENDPDEPDSWKHFPVRYRRDTSSTFGQDNLVGRARPVTMGGQGMSYSSLVGGGSRMAYSFSVEVQVWGDEMDVAMEREDVRKTAAVVMSRVLLALEGAGPTIGTGTLIQDDFGIKVVMGPYVGAMWSLQQAGEGLIANKRLWVYYVAEVPWSTGSW